MTNNFQRVGNKSNAAVGKEFEEKVYQLFLEKGIQLEKQVKVDIGINAKKAHAFDFGNDDYLVECKSHTWTETWKTPSGKLKNWVDSMFSFYLAPKIYRKFFIVEMDYNQDRCKTLLEYFIEHYYYLIPDDVILVDYYTDNNYLEFFVYDSESKVHLKSFDFKF